MRILNTSRLEDTKRLYEIIAAVKSRAQVSLTGAGHSTAVLRATAYSSPMAAFQDEMAGIGYYQFIEQLEKDFDQRKDELVKELRKLMKEILRPENFLISYTGERESLETVKKLTSDVKKGLCTESMEISGEKLTCTKKNEGFKTSGQVQYVAQTGNFKKKGLEYTGALEILKVILSYDYLWINLRVKGGAYGCMSGFYRNGDTYMVSYRDPNLAETNTIFEQAAEYVRRFDVSERDMVKFIIGTIGGMDTPMSPASKGVRSFGAYICHTEYAQLKKEREEVLNATKESIRALAPLIETAVSQDYLCVVGNNAKIRENEQMFEKIEPLFL